MPAKSKPVVLIALTAALGISLFQFAYGDNEKVLPAEPETAMLDEQEGTFPYRSNNYTMPEAAAGTLPVRPVPGGERPVAESERLAVYVSKSTLELTIVDKKSGYVWASTPSEKDVAEGQLNEEWKTAVVSPLLLQYYDENSMLVNGNYYTLGGKVEAAEPITGGTRFKLAFDQLQAGLAVELKLDGDSLVVTIPQQSIWEKGTAKLATLTPYPFLGSVHKADIPGYLFIPDRSGALIRFSKAHSRFDEPYVGKIYGFDYATDNMERYVGETAVPVFGIVHGVQKNGMMGIVENGKFNAEITAYPSGLSTNFYWIASKFYVRYGYFQPTSKNLGGFNTFQQEPIAEDRSLRYTFLSGEDADYVGMAKTYRGYLARHSGFARKTKPLPEMPLQIEMYGAETEPGMFGRSTVAMTSFDQARDIVDRLAKQGVKQLQVVYRGWNKGGLHATKPADFPVESKLGGERKLQQLNEYLTGQGVPLYLYDDFTHAFENTDLISLRTEAVRGINNEVVKWGFFGWAADDYFYDVLTHYINPGKAREIAEDHADRFREIGIGRMALDMTGRTLFSDYNADHPYTRDQSAAEYGKLAEGVKGRLGGLALYAPNDYMWRYADTIFHIPMGSSQYMYATDTVPFLQIVLHGAVPYFAPMSNTNSSPREDMLRMVEFGAYPSFAITAEPYWKLKNTPSTDLLNTQYDELEQTVTRRYAAMNEALKQVQDATIEARTVLDYGVVSVKYSNGVEVVVNYTSRSYDYGGIQVKAKDFAVIGGATS